MGKVVLVPQTTIETLLASSNPHLGGMPTELAAERCSPNMAMCGATGACLLCCFICGLADFLALCVGRRQGLPLLPPSPESWFLVNKLKTALTSKESAAWHFSQLFLDIWCVYPAKYSLALCALSNPF
jgi:hypothetical protein